MGHRMQHVKDHINLQLKGEEECGNQELCGLGLTREWSWLQLKSWLYVLSLGSLVAGWSAK